MDDEERQELEELANSFIIDYETATKEEKELLKTIDYIEEQIQRLDAERRRWLNVWRKVSEELNKRQRVNMGEMKE